MRTLREGLFRRVTYSERKAVVGSFQPFKRSIYGDTFLDPHEEMRQNWESYLYNSFTNAALNALARFVTGNEISVRSEDDKTADFLQKFLDNRNFEWEMLDAILKTYICGNGYIEIDFNERTGLPNKFYSIADPSRIYINFDKYGNPKTDDEAYLQRVDPIYNEPDARWYELSYHIGYSYHKIRIKAIPIHHRKIIHFKLNNSINGVYGRANITSSVNDNTTLQEIEKAFAMIVKFRAVPKKIIQLGDEEHPVDDEDMLRMSGYLANLDMDQNAMINKPFKMDDLSFSGKEVNMEYMLHHVRRKLIAGVTPEFLLGLGDEVNRATAHEQLTAFLLGVMSDRKIFTRQIEQKILKPIIKAKALEKDTWIEFGKLDFESEAEKTARVDTLWTTNAMTLNEVRKELGMSDVDNGDLFFGQWTQLMGGAEHFKPSAPVGAQAPLPTGQSPADAEGEPIGYQPPEEPFYEPSLEPSVAGVTFSEGFDPSGTRYIADRYVANAKVVFEQAKTEAANTFFFMRESFGQEQIDKVISLFETAVDLSKFDYDSMIEDSYVKGFAEAAKKMYLEKAPQPIDAKKQSIENLKEDSFKKVKSLTKKEREKLKAMLQTHVEKGHQLSTLSKRVTRAFDLTRYEGERIARSEVVRVFNEAVRDSILDSGITTKYEWVTSTAERVCKICRPLHGRVFDATKPVATSFENIGQKTKAGNTRVPLPVNSTHPNCRCMIVPKIDLLRQ